MSAKSTFDSVLIFHANKIESLQEYLTISKSYLTIIFWTSFQIPMKFSWNILNIFSNTYKVFIAIFEFEGLQNLNDKLCKRLLFISSLLTTFPETLDSGFSIKLIWIIYIFVDIIIHFLYLFGILNWNPLCENILGIKILLPIIYILKKARNFWKTIILKLDMLGSWYIIYSILSRWR